MSEHSLMRMRRKAYEETDRQTQRQETRENTAKSLMHTNKREHRKIINAYKVSQANREEYIIKGEQDKESD